MIVIPMAGRSQRFLDAGYDRPKHMLPLAGKSVFAHAVGSFEAEFGRTPFLIISAADAEAFVRAECAAMGLHDVAVVVLDRPTGGQAETVELGARDATRRPAFDYLADAPVRSEALERWWSWWRAVDKRLIPHPGSAVPLDRDLMPIRAIVASLTASRDQTPIAIGE